MTTQSTPETKTCGCGAVHTPAAWALLPYVGVMLGLELRNCAACHSTLAVEVAPPVETTEQVAA